MNFKSDESFQAFVQSLQLSQLSVSEASTKLASKGFVCGPSVRSQTASQVTCIKGLTGQQQSVELSPSPNDPSKSTVVASLLFVQA